jgi:hypothetical protein
MQVPGPRDFGIQPHLLAQPAQQTETPQPRGDAEGHAQQKTDHNNISRQ